MPNTRSQGHPLIPLYPKIERTLQERRLMAEEIRNPNLVENKEVRLAREVEPERIPVVNFVSPSLKNASKAIVNLEITKHFELKEGTVRLVQNTCQYHGKPHEDPHNS